MTRVPRRALLGGLTATAAVPGRAQAAWAPDRPVSFLGPFAAGGAFDLTQRALARGMEPVLGQPVAVVNRPGGAGTVMLTEIVRARPDGQTIALLSVNSNAVAPQLIELPYDPVGAVTPFLAYGAFMTFIVVARDAPFATLPEMIAFARREPGALTIGVAAIGANSHLQMARLVAQESVEVTFVPFTGGAPAGTALLGGHVRCAVVSGEILPAVRSGSLRLLAVLNDRRPPEFPDVPTLLDLGYGWAARPWLAVGGPRGLPPPIIARYVEAMDAAMATEHFRTVLRDLAIFPMRLSPEDTAKLMAESFAEHERIARALRIGRFAPR
jgi:tripartite-type tricarboxylate transporter receptor subunit TctC